MIKEKEKKENGIYKKIKSNIYKVESEEESPRKYSLVKSTFFLRGLIFFMTLGISS